MIPKVIHYCWFGEQPLPELAVRCITSWKKFMPDYEIKEWNELNFDVNMIPYTQEAYEKKKFAFVSDYARFWILYNYGGWYLDTDVEILKRPSDEICHTPFMACEQISSGWKFPFPPVNPGLGLASYKENEIIHEILDSYKNSHFCLDKNQLDLTTIVARTSLILSKYGLSNRQDIQHCADFAIYPREYFCPMNFHTGKTTITQNTVANHHYAASWVSKYDNLSLFAKIWIFLHLPNTDIRNKMKRLKIK